MILTMLVPTRGRPDNARRLLAACEATCVLPDTRIQLGVDSDDPKWGDYQAVHQGSDRAILTAWEPGERKGMVHTLNQMWHWRPLQFNMTDFIGQPRRTDVFGFMGDDHLPVTLGWDKALCDALAGKPAALAYGNDLLQGANIPTAVAMTASIPRTLGYMAPPELAHLYVDNTWLAWGHGLGAITYLPDVVIEHLHPVAGKADWDEGYRNVNAETSYSADRVAYEKYRTERLPADLEKLRAIR